MKKFEITIKKTEEVKKEVCGDWGRRYTDEQMKDHPKDEHGDPALAYYYQPTRLNIVQSTETIYTQSIGYLDLVAVIRAINGMEAPDAPES